MRGSTRRKGRFLYSTSRIDPCERRVEHPRLSFLDLPSDSVDIENISLRQDRWQALPQLGSWHKWKTRSCAQEFATKTEAQCYHSASLSLTLPQVGSLLPYRVSRMVTAWLLPASDGTRLRAEAANRSYILRHWETIPALCKDESSCRCQYTRLEVAKSLVCRLAISPAKITVLEDSTSVYQICLNTLLASNQVRKLFDADDATPMSSPTRKDSNVEARGEMNIWPCTTVDQ